MNPKAKKIADYLLRKAAEPTSWAGVAFAAPILAPHAPSTLVPFIQWGGPALGGLLLVVFNESPPVGPSS